MFSLACANAANVIRPTTVPFLRLTIRGKKWKPFHLPYRPKKTVAKSEAISAAVSSATSPGGKSVEEIPATASNVIPADACVVSPFQGMRLLRAFHPHSSDSSINLSARLDVDLTRESVRGVVNLPYALKTKIRLLVFCPDDEAKEMLALGADYAGITEISQKIEKGWLAFDRCIATPSIMRKVLPLARILGPKGLMPSPRSGTVVEDLRIAIRETKSGSMLEYRAKGEGDCDVTIGSTSFADAQLLENMKSFVNNLIRSRPKSQEVKVSIADDSAQENGGKKKPKGAGGNYFLKVHIKTEEGIRIPIDPQMVLPSSVGYFR